MKTQPQLGHDMANASDRVFEVLQEILDLQEETGRAVFEDLAVRLLSGL